MNNLPEQGTNTKKSKIYHDKCLSVAPMLNWTDRHERYFLRLISPHARLYTEMVTTGAILFGDRERLLTYNPEEHPVALQLGGCEPDDLQRCTVIGEQYGYDEVNLNVGCPSNRVQNGRFGACLMAEPERVADCVAAMQSAVTIPVTVKSRIGIDDLDSYDHLCRFIDTIAQKGCRTFIIHARKAWLKGLNPRQNREIPPLRYDVAHRIKKDFPHLEIVINGGLVDCSDTLEQLSHLDGVMIGRAAYQNPWLLAQLEYHLFNQPLPNRSRIVENYLLYVQAQFAQGVHLQTMTRHILGLFSGLPGARAWRRTISENAHRPDATPDILRTALNNMPEHFIDQGDSI